MTDRRTQPETTTDRTISRQDDNALFIASSYKKSRIEEEEFKKDERKILIKMIKCFNVIR